VKRPSLAGGSGGGGGGSTSSGLLASALTARPPAYLEARPWEACASRGAPGGGAHALVAAAIAHDGASIGLGGDSLDEKSVLWVKALLASKAAAPSETATSMDTSS
jgi:hypothetical protein